MHTHLLLEYVSVFLAFLGICTSAKLWQDVSEVLRKQVLFDNHIINL